MPTYAELVAEVGKLNTEVKEIFDQADERAAKGESSDLDSQSWEKVKSNNKRIEELEAQAKTILDQQQAREKAAERNRLPNPGALSGQQPKGGAGTGAQIKSIGQSVLDDPEFKAWREKAAERSSASRVPIGASPSVNVQGGMKTLLTGGSATSAGALIYPQFLGLQDMGTWMRPLTIRDLITNGETSGDVIEYVRFTGVTNNAAPVAEATATSGSSGAKPESAMAMEAVTTNVKTIAHWIPATRQALSDAGQLRTLIDQFLRYGLDEELEDQILNGDGTGQNFTGIHNVSGIQSQAWDTNVLTTTRKARTKVRVTGRATPTAYVMNPTDWETIDLLQDNEARYYFGGPSVLGNPRLWGLPVVESEAQGVGESMVADWRMAVVWDRMLAQILVSDSHADFFVRNLIAILAELRAAFGVFRPAAFVEIDMTA